MDCDDIRKKRDRCVSFSADEKTIIANICANYKNILENKKTDHVSASEKIEVWKSIASEVNALALNNTYRPPDVLKRFYENRKREVRKLAAEERKQIFGTGGGPEKKFKKDPCHDIILSVMNTKSVHGLKNTLDSDSNTSKETNSTEIENKKYIAENTQNLDRQLDQSENEQDSEPEIEISSNQWSDKDKNDLAIPSWKKASDLSKPITPALKRNLKDNESDAQRKQCTNTSRRRPAVAVKALTTSELSKKYNELLDKRLQLADFHLSKQKIELEQNTKEHNLRTVLLEMQIKIEKKKLQGFQSYDN